MNPINNLPAAALSFTFNNNVLSPHDWVFSKTSDSLYHLTNLDGLGTTPGIYKIGLDLSYFEKQSSGIKGNDIIYIVYELVDPNKKPVAHAGYDTTLQLITTYTLDASLSYDPDNDAIQYRWYPPDGIVLNDSSIAQPSFTITNVNQGADYIFLVSVDDGKETSTDAVRIKVMLDEELPIANCKDSLTIALDNNGQTMITADHLNDNSNDNLGIDTLFLDSYSFDCTALGLQSIELSVIDLAQNKATCQTIITVIDTVQPVVQCQDMVEIALNAQGKAFLTTQSIAQNAMDNCGVPSLTLSKSEFSCEDIGNQQITLTATDAAGNTTTCVTTVIITDATGTCNCGDTDQTINDEPIPAGTYMAVNTITSAGSVAPNTAVTFKAGTSITLQPGFHAEQGSEFFAIIESCTSPADNTLNKEAIQMTSSRQLPQTKEITLSTIPKLTIAPNPFSEQAMIELELSEATQLDLFVRDINGRIVAQLAQQAFFAKGKHTILYSPREKLAGTYFLLLQWENRIISKRMILVK